MKTFLLAAFFGLSLLDVSGQAKIGYIDTDALISSMPEATKAEAELKQFQMDLGAQYEELSKDFAAKDSAYVADSTKMSASMKKIKRDDLLAMYQRLGGWQEEAQQRYQQELQTKLAPIRQKAIDAIKAVAKESGYAYVMEESNGSLLVTPPSDNLLPLVRKKLNIVMPATPAGR